MCLVTGSALVPDADRLVEVVLVEVTQSPRGHAREYQTQLQANIAQMGGCPGGGRLAADVQKALPRMLAERFEPTDEEPNPDTGGYRRKAHILLTVGLLIAATILAGRQLGRREQSMARQG